MLRYLLDIVFLVWECSLSLLFRIVCISFFLTFSGARLVFAADVPITMEIGVGGVDQRNTCDPEFWDVLTDRAWMEAQREITQNQNLIPRPDSVLEITCFDSFLDELGSYSDSNFPSNPRWSGGASFLSVIDLILSVDQSALNAAPLLIAPLGTPTALFNGGSGSSGLIMTAALEVLVLDQLVDDVTEVFGVNISAVQDLLDRPLLAACAGEGLKQYYLEQFPDRMLGGRAIATSSTPGPAWSQILAGNSDGRVRDSGNYNGCSKMNDLWNRSKCYDFSTESYRHIIVPATPVTTPITAPPTPTATPPGGEHDSFYTLETYKNMAAASNDYRTRDGECAIPTTDGEPDWPSPGEFLCDVVAHGLPSGLTLSTFITGLALATNNNPTWDSAYTGANPDPDTTPATSTGAVDAYLHFLGLRDSSSCSSLTPIQTGYVVSVAGGVQYIDAVCPAPGCVFNPPADISSNGSCN